MPHHCWRSRRVPRRWATNSIWVGDSLLARPRHDPLTLLAGVAGRVPRVELAPPCCCRRCAIPCCWRTRSQRWTRCRKAADPRCRHRSRRAEHPRRIRRGGRAIREARRPHDGRPATVPRALERRAGGLARALGGDRGGVLAPTPHRPAARRYGSAATLPPAWSASASSSTAGSPTPRTRRPIRRAMAARCERSPLPPAAMHRACQAPCI